MNYIMIISNYNNIYNNKNMLYLFHLISYYIIQIFNLFYKFVNLN